MVNTTRPIRDAQESITERVPTGPLGFVGEGNAVGTVGFGIVTLANNLSPIPLGHSIKSSESSDGGENLEIHEYEIWSASKDVARTVARTDASGPNLNFLSDKSEVVRLEQKRERSGFSLWFVRVEIERRDRAEEAADRGVMA